MDSKEVVAYLKTPKAIRDQCGKLFALAEEGKLNHFRFRPDKLEPAADYVLTVIKEEYPKLDIPYHSRWRHFDAGRMEKLVAATKDLDLEEQARVRFELAITSVLLDAGAGMKWQYKDDAGKTYDKSEGLAVASFDMFLDGGFSGDPERALMADPAGLKAVGKNQLSAYFQVSAQNPLQGFDGRLNLLHKLGGQILTHPKIFGDIEPRLGNLFDYLAAQAANDKLPARKILAGVLDGLGGIWPGRVALGGTNLGDVWKHSLLPQGDLGFGLVPFHKLSQWLTYSLIEPMEEAGFVIGDLDELTGLAEYRNGGLFLDLGVIEPKSPAVTAETHKPDSEVIIEWRALTVCLLDQVADLVRERLGLSPLDFPLAKVLQGGTWTAGRRIAKKLRSDGGPPIKLASDGTVF